MDVEVASAVRDGRHLHPIQGHAAGGLAEMDEKVLMSASEAKA